MIIEGVNVDLTGSRGTDKSFQGGSNISEG